MLPYLKNISINCRCAFVLFYCGNFMKTFSFHVMHLFIFFRHDPLDNHKMLPYML